MNNNCITSFSGPNRFLSNFSYAIVELDGMLYPSVEHAYQAAKTKELNERISIQQARGAGKAKQLGRQVTLRPDWDEIKRSVMLELVRKKFTSDKRLKSLLLCTGSMKLIEGNTWNDTYWGVCQGVGENHLGKILMQVREEIKEKETKQ